MIVSIEQEGIHESAQLTTNHLKASAWAMNQQAINKPIASRIVPIVNQSFRAHQSVKRKQTPRTKLATLLATISNPAKIKRAPMMDDPRYPAGNVIADIPPLICVTPPSWGSSEIDSTLPPVQHAVIAWPNSWKAITNICFFFSWVTVGAHGSCLP